MTITKEEAQALLQIIDRADFKGGEVMGVAQLIQKIAQAVNAPEEDANPAPVKKKD